MFFFFFKQKTAYEMRISDWSSDVCSSDLDQDRAALACHLVIDRDGALKSWRFTRAVIRCVANLAYEDAQAAINGTIAHPLTKDVLRPLWGAWAALAKARDKREPLEDRKSTRLNSSH